MKRFLTTLLAFSALPLTAHADLFGFHAAAKADYFSGSGDMFTRFDGDFAYGLELGVELIGVDIWAEAMMMGTDQYFFTANLGVGFEFGEALLFDVGIYTGPMFFLFPEDNGSALVLEDDLAHDMQIVGIDPTGFEQNYNSAMSQSEDLGRVAMGWNLGRLRLSLAYELFPSVSMGVEATAAYHYIISGDDIAAGSKNQAIDKMVKQYQEMPRELVTRLRSAVGAKEVDTDELNGFNFSGGLFLRFKI